MSKKPKFELLTVYLTKVTSTDDVLKKYAPGAHKTDVLVYRDPEKTKLMARFPWDHSKKPHKGTKRVTLNCYLWNAVWLPD